MQITLYGLKACDTCRKAKKALENKGLEVGFVDVREAGVPRAELERFLAAFDADVINRKSATWRAFSDEERKKEAIDLLQDHPAVMKRPVIDADGTLYLGWSADVQAALL
jgi:Spx/MgsR family transcriptional regulator